MMKKLLVFLCILFLVPAAAFQGAAAYTPGQITYPLFANAFDQGDMILADVAASFTFNEGAAVLLEEEPALLSAISEAMQNTTLTLGAGKLDNGIRFFLGGEYAVNDQQVELDATLDLTTDGLFIMSSVIPGERLSIQWETLMELAEISPAEVAQVQMLSEADMEAALEELAAQLEPMIEVAAQIAAPYGETVLKHIEALPIEVLENVPAEGAYPAAATEINVTITAKALGDLITDLATQLEADATLCAIFDVILAESGEDITTAEFCAAMREIAAQSLTDESSPLTIFLGMDEADEFLYLHIGADTADSGSVIFGVLTQPFTKDPSKQLNAVSLLSADADGNPTDGISLAFTWPQEEVADVLLDTQGLLQLYEDAEIVTAFEFELNEVTTSTQDGLPSQIGTYALSLDLAEDGVTIALNLDSQQNQTADGGEEGELSGVLNISSGDMTVPLSFQTHSLTTPAQDEPTLLYAASFQAPDLGIDDSLSGFMVYTDASKPDLSAMTEIAVETATPEALNALAERAQLALEDVLVKLTEMLPAALTQEAL